MSRCRTLTRAVANEIRLRQSLTTAQNALTAARLAQTASAQLVRSLQDSLLPPVLVPVPGLEVAASYLPASGDTVVGDFYDLFHIRGPWWCAVLGDVCGHGVEAAKVTALARYTLRAEATRNLSPAVVLDRLNTAMIAQRGRERFLTAVYVTFRVTPNGVSGRLCIAGHPPALIRRADGRVHKLGRRGTLLGMLDQLTLVDVRFRLAPGDTLLLYTDGATEARPPAIPGVARPEFGEDGLEQALAQCREVDPAAIVAHLADAVNQHNRGRADDDTALLALRVPQPAAERIP